MENYVLISLSWFAEAVPEVADILSALPSPPERVAKDRHCALPGCEMVGTGLHTNLKKCNRCMAVYYCSKEHQNVHWPEHKSTCVRATLLVGAGQHADNAQSYFTYYCVQKTKRQFAGIYWEVFPFVAGKRLSTEVRLFKLKFHKIGNAISKVAEIGIYEGCATFCHKIIREIGAKLLIR
jgi:hypothetical protein